MAPNRGWVLALLSGGRLQFSWSTDGSNSNNVISTSLGLAPGERAAVRVTLDVDNGASGRTVTFYKGPSLAGPWTTVGSPFVQAGTTSTFAASAPLGVGDLGFIGWVGVPDRMHGAEVRAGIGGTVAARVDWSTAAVGATSHTDTTGRVWTLEGTAELTKLVPIFVGEVASWPSRWAPSGQDAWVPVEGAGILRRMQQGRKALTSTLRRRIPSGSPVAYWPMEEGDSATQAYSPVPGCQPLTAPGLDWAAADTLPGSSPLPAITAGATLRATVPAYPASTSWQLEFVYFRATEPTLLMPILELATGVSPWPRLSVRMGPGGGVTVMGFGVDGESSSAVLTGGSGPIAGQWNRFRLTLTQDGSLVRIAVVIIPIGGAGVAWNQSFTGTVGPLRTISGSYTSVLEGTAVGHITFFARTGVSVMDFADHGYTRESAGARALRIATEEGVQLSVLGDPADSALMGPQRPQTLVELLHECAEADGGILMERPNALGLMYRTRTSLYSQTPTLALPYGAIAPSLEPVEDDQAVRNDLTVTRRGGGSGRSVVETGPLSVLPSEQGGVGIYDEALELNLADDAQAQPMAEWLAHLGTVDEARYPSIKINLHEHPELIAAVLRLRIGDLVRLTDLPLWVGDSTTDLHVMQIQHEPRPRAWTVTLVCTPASPYRVWVVEDPVLGRADTDGSELAGAVAATDTVLPVTVTAGPSWVTAAPNVLTDPGMESGTGAWACTRGASIGVVSHETGIVHSGTGALRVTRVHPTDTGTLNLWDPTANLAAAAGQTWAGGAWVYSGGASANNMRCAIVWRDAGGVETFMYGSAPSVSAGTWTYLSVSATLPAGAVGVRLGVEGRSTWTVGEWWIADDVRLARTDTHTGLDLGDQFPFDVTVGGEVVTVHSIGSPFSPTVADTFTRGALPPTVTDAFDRTVTGGWGTATTGQAWTNSGGTSADYAVGSGVGTVSAGVVNSSRFTQLATLALADVDMQADVTVPVVATGASISTGLRLRAADTSTYYYVEVVRATAGTISVLLVSRVAGVSTTIAAAVSKGAYSAGQTWTVRARLVGSVLQAKLWASAGAEPAGWDVQAYTTSISAAGPVGTRTILSGGNTNTLPVVATWDNIRATAVELGWGTSTSGHTWTRSGGSATEYTVDGRRGLIALTSADSSRRIITGPTLADTDIRAAMTVPVVAATDSIDMAVMSRHQDSGTYYHAVLHCHADATIDVRIRKVVAGTYTTLSISALLPGTYAAGDTYWVRFQTTGTNLQARGWKDGTAEPGTWQATATDSSITAPGQTGVRMNLQVNNTNTLPVIVSVDQYEVSGPMPFHVARSANGIVKGHAVGADLSLTHPMRAAL
ncbi:hypothetical protein ACIOWM_07175 [Streptomyces anulatus]